VSELADDGIPVTVTCRVLKLSRQPYYRWLAAPVTDRDWDEAHLANAIFDAHRDDPEFGYRFLADEVHDAGHAVCERTVWKRCSENGWWSVFGKKKTRKRSQPGTPSHDDLVRREFTAAAPNQLWLADITEHRTDEGKLYLCAIKDVFSNRIVGWSIDSRMKARLVVAAIDTAVARRGDVDGCILHSDRGSQFRARKSTEHSSVTTWPDPWAGSAPPLTTRRWNRSSRCSNATSSTVSAGRPATSCASRSSPESNAPITVDADRPPSDD
jgi:putative transposase